MKRTGKYVVGLFASIMIMMFAFALTSYAQTDYISLERQSKEVTVTDQYVDSFKSFVAGTARGRLISSVDVQISKEGFGVAGLYGDVLCHEPMGSIRIVLILQKWDEEDSAWDEVNRQQFDWNASDLPEGEELTMASVSYNIAGLQSGQTYRVRALCGAHSLDGKASEAWNASTEGLKF